MPDYYIYRPRTTWIYLALIVVVGGLATGSYFAVGKFQEGLIALINSLAVAGLLWVFVVQPKVVYTTSGIEIHNPFVTIKVGWLTAEDFVTKYSFTVVYQETKVSAWAAPSSSRQGKDMHDSDYRGTGLESRKVIATSDSPRTQSGTAMILALRHSEHAIQKGTASDHAVKKINFQTVVICLVSIGILIFTLSQ